MGAEFADLLVEHRSFPPPPSFQNQARIQDEQIYAEADRDPEGFWAKSADELVWSRVRRDQTAWPIRRSSPG
jgi:hypothetical protein